MIVAIAAPLYLLAYWAVSWRPVRYRLELLAAFGVAALFAAHYWTLEKGFIHFAAYVIFVALSYALTDPRLLKRKSTLHYIPLFFPVAMMVSVKAYPWVLLVGASYTCFRLSYLVMEVRDGLATRPSFSEYLCFAFFPPLLTIGPITSFRLFREGLYRPDWSKTPPMTSVLRMIFGATKYLFIANLFQPLIPVMLFRDRYMHGWMDLTISTTAYYFFLYFNFSGYIDMVIGFSGLLGIPVQENFNEPILARNIQDFWRRWHITLANFMRDIVFAPFVKYTAKRTKGRHYDHIVALGVLITFVLTGVWHGFTLAFLYYGFVHGIGLATHHYYSRWLQRRLGPRLAAYNANPWIRLCTTILTFYYIAFSFFLFAFPLEKLKPLFEAMCWTRF